MLPGKGVGGLDGGNEMSVRGDGTGQNRLEYGVIVGLVSLALVLTLIVIVNLTRAI